MRLLLDTHIWLWHHADSHLLAVAVKRELNNEKNEIWLSPVSTWEALTLHRKGRIRIFESLDRWVARMTENLYEAPLTHEIARISASLEMHNDPADRLIAATAQALDLTLVTADDKLLGLGTIRTMANR